VVSVDMFSAMSTAIQRHFFDRYPDLPWLAYPAIRFLDERLHGRRLFEFGSGTSTLWYARRCQEVNSVENNPAWAQLVTSRLNVVNNATLRYADTDAEVIRTVSDSGGYFDAIVVDNQPKEKRGEFYDSDHFRVACLRAA